MSVIKGKKTSKLQNNKKTNLRFIFNYFRMKNSYRDITKTILNKSEQEVMK